MSGVLCVVRKISTASYNRLSQFKSATIQ